MIGLDVIAPGVLRVVAPVKLSTEDFAALAPKVDSVLVSSGKVRLLIDATRLEGWDSMDAFERHAAFVKAHVQNVERIAVIAGREWQHWLVGAVKIFLHPSVRVFDQSAAEQALRWIENKQAVATEL